MEKIKKYINLYKYTNKKRKNNLMIFGAWFGKKYDDNPRYLYEYVVKNRPDLKAVWMTESIDVFNQLKNNGLPVCMSGSEEGKEYAKNAKYVFTATGRIDVGEENVQYLGGACYINLWHGIPLKKIMYDDVYSVQSKKNWKSLLRDLIEKIPNRNYYVVSTSDEISKIYESAFRVKKEQILQLGQPRNDYFFSGHVNKYNEQFPGKKIILYMPTHRNEGKQMMDVSKLFDLDEINTLCKENNAVLLIKKHFYHAGENDVTKDYDSVFDITNDRTETQVLLDAASTLITDYSSCYIDYLLLDRPIVFYNYDMSNYEQNDRQLYFEYEQVTPGKKCGSYQDVKSVLNDIFENNDEYKEERSKVRDLFYDKSAQKAVASKIIERVLNL